MKIMKLGDASKRVAREDATMDAKCVNCGALLAICPRDLDSEGGIIRKLRYHFTCPECRKWTYILPEKLEPSFRRCVDLVIANRRFWQD